MDYVIETDEINNTTNSTIDSFCNYSTINEVVNFSNTIKVLKIFAFLLHIGFFVVIVYFKELHTRHMIYLINLGVTSFSYVLYGLFTFDSHIICRTHSKGFCEFQAYFSHYCVNLFANGIIALAVYRSTCVSLNFLKRHLTVKKILASILVIWFLPIVTVVMPGKVLDLPIQFNSKTSNCRMSFLNYFGYLIVYICITNVIPSIIIIVSYTTIVLKLKLSKHRVHPIKVQYSTININFTNNNSTTSSKTILQLMQIYYEKRRQSHSSVYPIKSAKDEASSLKPLPKQNLPIITEHTVVRFGKLVNNDHPPHRLRTISAQTKLALQFLVLFLNYELFAISKIIYNIDFREGEGHSKLNLIEVSVLKLFIWIHFVLNPIIYLVFNPHIVSKLKSIFKRDQQKLTKNEVFTLSASLGNHKLNDEATKNATNTHE